VQRWWRDGKRLVVVALRGYRRLREACISGGSGSLMMEEEGGTKK